MENLNYVTLRIRKVTHKKLRLIAANTDESIIEVMERLAAEELRKVQTSSEPKVKKEHE